MISSLPTIKFSVLISLYDGELTENFNQSMNSIWKTTSIKPNEIILIIDGPIRQELTKLVNHWEKEIPPLKAIFLKKNVGLGDALNIGLEKCKHELIARMDTDDICRKDRFEKQLRVFNENNDVDICSSWVSEFEQDQSIITSQRKLPESHVTILKYAKSRNPINHPAVMYKKEAVIKAGSYKPMKWFEDYYLWARMLINGAKFYNIQEPLVNMRAGYKQLERRSGIQYAKAEFFFLRKLLKIGFLSHLQFLKNLILRLSVRILPKLILSYIYRKLLRI